MCLIAIPLAVLMLVVPPVTKFFRRRSEKPEMRIQMIDGSRWICKGKWDKSMPDGVQCTRVGDFGSDKRTYP